MKKVVPDSTSDTFAPDPFAANPASRVLPVAVRAMNPHDRSIVRFREPDDLLGIGDGIGKRAVVKHRLPGFERGPGEFGRPLKSACSK